MTSVWEKGYPAAKNIAFEASIGSLSYRSDYEKYKNLFRSHKPLVELFEAIAGPSQAPLPETPDVTQYSQ